MNHTFVTFTASTGYSIEIDVTAEAIRNNKTEGEVIQSYIDAGYFEGSVRYGPAIPVLPMANATGIGCLLALLTIPLIILGIL